MATAVAGCMEGRTTREHELVQLLHPHKLFADVDEAELACLVAESHEVTHEDGVLLTAESGQMRELLILLDGAVRVSRHGTSGNEIFQKIVRAPSFMGEMQILTNVDNLITVVTLGAGSGLHVPEEGFWRLMSTCPGLRSVILKEVRFRTQGMQAMDSQQQKLAILGTMTAGLMHELNNPGAAARRAASQLRENLNRLHLLARSFSERGHSEEQRACLTRLQERVLATKGDVCMDSLQQSDREEELGNWMDEHGVKNGWNVAPTLVSSGIAMGDLECLQAVFPGDAIQEPIEWLEATASSMQQVALVEDSVSRVHDLAKAAKTYVHEGQGGQQTVQVNESIHATLVILKHKLHEKHIKVEKQFGPNLPPLTCVCSGLNQIWTNLLDNAIDAVGQDGHIRVRTWQEGSDILVGIQDDGPGIRPEDKERIFEPFYTTKPAGVGTGMGLGIVQRTIEDYRGGLTLTSGEGSTEFVVRIPVDGSARSAAA